MVCGDWLASIAGRREHSPRSLRVNKAWIHDRAEWPRFTWDDAALTSVLAGVRHLQGRHLGSVEALGFDVRAETNIAALTDEVVRSSAIEGEHLDPGEVRSSIARRLGIDTTATSLPRSTPSSPSARPTPRCATSATCSHVPSSSATPAAAAAPATGLPPPHN